MKRILLGVLVAVGLISNIAGVPASALDTNNYRIQSFDIQYYLTRDGDGHSQLKTIKRITAVFPDYDQNHGLQHAIPETYNGHTTNLSVESVEMADGTPWEYSTSSKNDNLVLRIGNASSYVHGEQTYIITHTEQDVTRYFSNTNADEFYWDTVGTDGKVPIDKLTVSLAIEDSLQSKLSGKTACYEGYSGESGKCTLDQAANIFTTESSNLGAGKNITIAVGFEPDTFTEYQPSLLERLFSIWIIVTIAVGAVGLGIMIWLFTKWMAWSKRKKDVGTIVPEYIPPSDASLSTIASLVQPRGSVFTAQLIDFAVRHYIKIYETNKKTLFKSADYLVEVGQDISGLKQEEQEILTDIFQGPVSIGHRISLSSLKNNAAVYNKIQDNDSKLTQLVRGSYALRERNPTQSAWFKKAGWILLIVAIVTLNPIMLLAAGSAFVCGYTLWPLTDKGVALYRYAEGMKMYIHVAEAERLRLLQSPEGAAKVGSVDVNDSSQLLKLYERMLPYAIFFGQEKEWSKRIGDLYATSQTSPGWYSGQTAFNAAVFATAISTFSSNVAYSAPYESSSGGSSGGGFSGGGGGGGGTSGW